MSFASTQDITDLAGNALDNTTPPSPNDNTYLMDNTAPTVTISGVPATSSAAFTATFNFSEDVSGFVLAHIAVGNGAASAFTNTTAGTTWTALITPAGNGAVTVDVAAGVATDAAGNGNTAATQATSTYTAPTPPPPSPAHCDMSDPNEIWCVTLTVGSSGTGASIVYGYAHRFGSSDVGSVSPNPFTYRGLSILVTALNYTATALRFKISVDTSATIPSDGLGSGILGSANYSLEFGTGASKKTFAINNPGSSGAFTFPSHGLSWSVGDTVPVKLVREVPPEHCNLSDPNEVWCATLTVGERGNHYHRGYARSGRPHGPYGSLSHTSFSHRGTTYTIDEIREGGLSALSIKFSPDGRNIFSSVGYKLVVDNREFNLNQHNKYTSSRGFRWYGRGLNWWGRDGDTVQVKLVQGALGSEPGLVNNLTKRVSAGRRLDWLDHGQKFTTGSHSGGYTITSVDAVLHNVNNNGNFPTVKIRSTGTGAADVATLSKPTSGAAGGDKLYRYTATGVTLSASTTYRISFSGGSSSVRRTGWTGVDSRSAAGWSIAPNTERRWKSWQGHGGTDWKTARNRSSTTLRINGAASSMQTEVNPPVVDGAPSVTGSGGDGAWDEGDTIEATVTFSEAVNVDTTGGTPSISVQLGLGETRSAIYTSGHGTTELVFEYPLIAGDGSHGSSGVAPNSLETGGGTIRSAATGTDAVLEHNGVLVVAPPPSTTMRSPPEVSFDNVPSEHDGSTPFTVRVHFSGTPQGLSASRDAADVIDVAGGQITQARATSKGQNPDWEITIDPDGGANVEVSVPPKACSETNAVCIGGQSLDRTAEATIEANLPGPDPIVASWEDVPDEHDGSSQFMIKLKLDPPPVGFSYRWIAASVVTAEGGTITKVNRLVKFSNLRWRVYVTPSGNEDVTLTVNATTDCEAQHAACTAEGGMLEGGATITILGPALFSVADAEVDEADGATLDFVVSLSRKRSESSTVSYATSDGTAHAGDDYTATNGTLTFAANETSKTVPVPVLDDAHDDGGETMTLTLSNPAPATVKLADATATGTINNTDAMPQAWIARFGRTVAEQVIDAVEGRLRASRQPGAEVSLGGQRIGLGPLFGAGRERPSGDAPAGDGAGDGEARKAAALADAQEAGADRAAADLAAWLKGETDPEAEQAGTGQAMAGRELLLGSSFSMTAGTPDEGLVSFWGRGAVTRFDGREGELTLDGEVTSAMMGADWHWERWTTGLAIAHSLGEGGYREGANGGTVETSLTGLYPWLRHALTERLEAWGVAGYGEGDLTLTPEGSAAIRTDLDLWMAAAGLRGTLMDGGGEGLTLTGKTDAMIVGTSTDSVSGAGGNLAAAEAEVTRLRVGLEGALPVRLADGSVLVPGLELGVRHDGGDAETGFGADIGASLAWTDAKRGLSAELRGRGLLAHEAKGFRERGLSGAFSWDPVEGERGPRLSLTQTMGRASSGGAEALLGRGTLEGLAANDNGDELKSRRLEARFGYGFAAFGDRFTWTPEAGLGLSDTGRDLSLGWRLVRRSSPGDIGSLELSFEATRRESANDDTPPDHSVGLKMNVRW